MITAIRRLTMQSHMSYSSCSCFCLLDRTIQICVSCFRAVKIWCFEYNSLKLITGCSTWHLMAKNSEDLRIRIFALHKDGLGYKKFGNSLELSLQYSGQGHTEVFQDRFHSEQASQELIKEVVSLCCASGFRSWLQKTDAWVLPALL